MLTGMIFFGALVIW